MKVYKHVFTVTILSHQEFIDSDLMDDCDTGDSLCSTKLVSRIELTPAEIGKESIALGSDAEFFW